MIPGDAAWRALCRRSYRAVDELVAQGRDPAVVLAATDRCRARARTPEAALRLKFLGDEIADCGYEFGR